MKFSLLQKKEDSYAVCDVVYDLSIDRAIANLIEDKRKADYFLSVLSKPLADIDNIVYRQQIYTDFKTIPGLLDELKVLFARYDKIKSDWQEMKPGGASVRASEVNPEAMLEHTFSSLKVTAIFPSTIVSFFATIGQTLSQYPIKSEGLTKIRDWCREMSENAALDELVEISQLFRYRSVEDFDFTTVVELDRALCLSCCDISDISEHKSKSTFGKLFGKKKEDDGFLPVSSEISGAGEDPYSDSVYMLSEALLRIDTLLSSVTGEVYDAFFGMSNELMFYEGAILYADSAESDLLPLTLPTLLPQEDDCFDAKELYELLLLSLGAGKKTVPNDLCLTGEFAGMLVKGLTDSGKTVFLRAAAIAQIFAQSGLPVLAREARLSIRRGFFSHFSSAEEEFLKGDASGRFDQEAREISRIINMLCPYSFLLLNETFQTTSYREGTESIYNILRFMPKLKTKYLFVTHLTGLFDHMKGENVVLARTSDDPEDKYKILV